METAFCWLAHAWFYQWFHHFNRKVNVVTTVTSAKRPYFYFRSKIWCHHRVPRPRCFLRRGNFGDSATNKGQIQYFLLRMRKTTTFLLPVKNLTSPSSSVGTVKRFERHHRAKFLQNRTNRGWDITIFRFFQDGGRPPSWNCNACVGPPTKGIWWSLSLCKI